MGARLLSFVTQSSRILRIRGVLSISFPEYQVFCNVLLLDGQIQSESEHTSLTDKHARLILWQTGPILDLLQWFDCMINPFSSVRKGCRLNLEFDMLDLNTGFALVVRLNTLFQKMLPGGTFSSIWVNRTRSILW